MNRTTMVPAISKILEIPVCRQLQYEMVRAKDKVVFVGPGSKSDLG